LTTAPGRARKDILTEYSEFRIMELLNEAANLATQRANLTPAQYIQRAQQIRERAATIINQTKIERYPDDLRNIVKQSQYSSALPAEIAQVLLNGFPDYKETAISSSEVGLYVQLANTLRTELNALRVASQKFNIDEITIPEGEISIDVIIPRTVFGNRADEFVDILTRIIKIAAYIIEVTTGSEGTPTLAYNSTSDPVTGLALIAAVAWGFLRFYKAALEVAEKQINLLRMVKEFRGSPLESSGDLDTQIKAITDESLEKAVKNTIEAMPEKKVPSERINEIEIAIKREARVVVQAIANGVRVGVTIESLDTLVLIAEKVPDITPEQVTEELKNQRVLEDRVQQSLALLGEPAPPLLPRGNPETDEAKT
jgi:hypothetical protein